MLVLDTDHLSLISSPSGQGKALVVRLNQANDSVATTAVTLEENLQGWMHVIHHSKAPGGVIAGYQKLVSTVRFFAGWTILPWNEDALEIFLELKSQGVRTKTHDLRIASIVLAHQATLLTRNSVDFERIPGLRFENWIDD